MSENQYRRINASGSGTKSDYRFYRKNGWLHFSRDIALLPPEPGMGTKAAVEFEINVIPGRITDARFNPDKPIVVGKPGPKGCPVSNEGGFEWEILSPRKLRLTVDRTDEFELAYLMNFDVIRQGEAQWVPARPLDPKIRNKPTLLNQTFVLVLFSALLAIALVWIFGSR